MMRRSVAANISATDYTTHATPYERICAIPHRHFIRRAFAPDFRPERPPLRSGGVASDERDDARRKQRGKRGQKRADAARSITLRCARARC
jgi:hypothetical protein